MTERFERNARTVTLLTFVSRVTGLARDAAMSRIFGISATVDAFWFAFIIPNLFRRLFGEGALSAAFLPIYSQLNRTDPRVAKKLATLTLSLLIVFLGGITLIGEGVLYVMSLRQGHDHLALRLMMIMLPYMPLVCVVAILGAMLQVHGRFGPTAAAPIVLNLCIVIAAIGFANGEPAALNARTHITYVAIAVLIAGILQVAWSVLALQRLRIESNPDSSSQNNVVNIQREATAAFKRVLLMAWPTILGFGVLQLNTFLDGLIASYPSLIGPTIFGVDFPLKQGALTALSNAQRLYEFPLGVFGIAVATAIFPALAKVADDRDSFGHILRRGLRLVVYIGLPASVGVLLVREPLTAAILQGKNFTSEDTRRVAFVLMGYAPAIWAYSMTHTLTRAFYAKGDAKTPMKVAIWMVLLNLTLNLTLIWTPLREAGLAWSTALCAIVQVMILLKLIGKHAENVVDHDVFISWMKTAIITSIMAAAVVVADAWLAPSPALAGTWRWSVIELSGLVGVGAGVVVAASLMLRLPELAWALGRRGK